MIYIDAWCSKETALKCLWMPLTTSQASCDSVGRDDQRGDRRPDRYTEDFAISDYKKSNPMLCLTLSIMSSANVLW